MTDTNNTPESIDALLEDRMVFWKSFNSATVIGATAVVLLLVGMWIFLV